MIELPQPHFRVREPDQVKRHTNESAPILFAKGASQPEFMMHASMENSIELRGIRTSIQHGEIFGVLPVLSVPQFKFDAFEEPRAW